MFPETSQQDDAMGPMGSMQIPANIPDNVLGAALAYAAAGIYILPIAPRTKHPGSVLGRGWPAQSSVDPKVLTSWFAGSNHGLAAHLGRSGLVAFDVDNPAQLPAGLRNIMAESDPPFQSTRTGKTGRGHYIFQQPAGRCLGNSQGQLPGGWGDIRGKNGIIVMEPTPHMKADEGGRYLWKVCGEIPVLGDAIANLLPDALPSDEPATQIEVQSFLKTYTEATRPSRLTSIVRKYQTDVAEGASRHVTLVACLTWACREVIAGHISARTMRSELLAAHTSALADGAHPNGPDPHRHDFANSLAWALSQALDSPSNGSMRTDTKISGGPHDRQRSTVDSRAADFVDFADSADAPLDFAVIPSPLQRTAVVPEFPVEALPREVGDMVRAVAESTQTDTGMAGVVALGVMAAASGGSVEVQVSPGYVEPTNLFTAVIARPAERKSAVCTIMTDPLVALEAEMVRITAPFIEEQRTRKEIAEKIAERAKHVAGKSDPSTRDQATDESVKAAADATAINVDELPQIIADDITLEALGSRLAAQGGRLAIVSTEGGFLATAAGRYAPNPDLSVLLKAHAGDRFRVDRIGRPTEFVDKPALTLVMMVQPGVLAERSANRAFHDSGLLARFLFAYPSSPLGHRAVDPTPLNPIIAAAYGSRIGDVARQLRNSQEATVLTFDAAADAVRLNYAREVEPKLAPDGELAHIGTWAGKLVGATTRLAGLLHLFEPGCAASTVISEATMRSAVTLGKYFTAHAQHVFDELAAPEDDLQIARQLVALIGRKYASREFSQRDLLSAASRSWMPNAESLCNTLNTLVDMGWVMPIPDTLAEGRAGRPAGHRYRAHPWCYEPPPQNPRNTQKTTAGSPPTASNDVFKQQAQMAQGGYPKRRVAKRDRKSDHPPAVDA